MWKLPVIAGWARVGESWPSRDKNIPFGLDIEIKEDAYEEKFGVNSPPKAEPNKRDLHSSYNEVEHLRCVI